MTLPLTTTNVDISAGSTSGDAWEPRTYTPRGRHPANVTQPSASDLAGSQQAVDAVLHVNPGVDVGPADRVTDTATGMVYEVTWVLPRTGLGLDHIRAGLKRVVGVPQG